MKFRKNREPLSIFFDSFFSDCFFWIFKRKACLSLCLPCIPYVIISFPFLSDPFLSLPNEFLSLSHPHYFSASPSSTMLFWNKLCPFPFHLLFLCHWVHSPVFSLLPFTAEVWMEGRGHRDANTESATRLLLPILSFWSTSTYKGPSEIVNLHQWAHICSSRFFISICF